MAGSININGVTRLRPAIRFEDHSGNAFAINTSNITANKILHVVVWGFVPDYA